MSDKDFEAMYRFERRVAYSAQRDATKHRKMVEAAKQVIAKEESDEQYATFGEFMDALKVALNVKDSIT